MARQVIYDQAGVLSTIAAFLKLDYVETNIRVLYNASTEFLDRIKTKPTDVGEAWVEPIKTAVAQGVGARGENVPLPNPGFGVYKRIQGNVKYNYGSFYITDQSIKATKGNRASLKNALTTALEDTKEGLKLDFQRQAWGDGSAVLGRIATTATSTVQAVSDPYGLTYDQDDLQGFEKVLCFRENMQVHIYTPGGGGTDLYRTITAVDASAGTITFNSSAACLAGDEIYRADGAGASNVGNEVSGIMSFMKTTGNYFNLPRAGNSVLQANIIPFNGDIAFLEDDFIAATYAGFRNATEQPDLVMANTRVHQLFARQLRAERRQVNPVTLKSGQTAVDFAGKPFAVDKDAPPQRAFFLRMNDIFWRQMGEAGWLDEDGTVLHQFVGSDGRRAAWEATWADYKELVTRAPRNHTMIEGIINETAEA